MLFWQEGEKETQIKDIIYDRGVYMYMSKN